jgi:hypothetical protein
MTRVTCGFSTGFCSLDDSAEFSENFEPKISPIG